MKFTVLGSTGFIGRRMVAHLQSHDIEVETPPRDAADLRGRNLGHVIYAIGLTGNFRSQPQAAIEAHVNVLQKLMDCADFESWLYLSSTRVYGGLPSGVLATEDAALTVRPGPDSLYDLSKLLGEAICVAKDSATVRVARLANVYGAGQSEHTFLGSVIHELARNGKVTIGESPPSSKDYISVENVVTLLKLIATQGRERIYNVASGQPVTHQDLADIMRQCRYNVEFSAHAPARIFPAIDTARIIGEFGEKPRSILQDLPTLIEEEKHFQGDAHAKVRKNEKTRH